MIGKAQKATCTSHRDEKFQQLHKIAVGKKKFAKKISSHSSILLPSLTHSAFHLLLTLHLLSVSAMHLHTHSSHASTFLLLSSSISPFLHLLLRLPVSFSPSSLPPCNTFLGEQDLGCCCCCWPGLLAAE